MRWIIFGGIFYFLIGHPMINLWLGHRHAKKACASVSIGDDVNLDKLRSLATDLELDFTNFEPKPDRDEGYIMIYAHTMPRPAICNIHYDKSLKITRINAEIAD